MIKYRPEIDGLRAVAVVPVILFHAGFQTFSGGFVGVDVFFVISGYLITSIILADKKAGNFSFVSFYERRARRILPALFAVVIACMPFAWLWMLPLELKDFLQSLASVSVFSSNILFWLESGYFAPAAELKPLLHTWSLAVEEQYYVLFPILLVSIYPLLARQALTILFAVSILSFLTAEWWSMTNPSAAFYLLPARAWELLMGSFVAYYFFGKVEHSNNFPDTSVIQFGKVLSNLLSIIGLSLIFYAVFAFDESTLFPGHNALIPVLGTALVIIFCRPDTLIGKLLSSKVFVKVGLLSYSLYLWHQPLFSFARLQSKGTQSEPGALHFLILVASSFLFAYLSWKYIETPFRNKKKYNRARIFTLAITVSLALLALGLIGQSNNGFESYYYNNRLTASQQKVYSLITKHAPRNRMDMDDNGECNFWAKYADENFTRRFQDCAAKHGKGVVVLGDSHAMNIYSALYKSQYADFLVGISRGGCRPHDDFPHCRLTQIESFFVENKSSIDYILYNQSGSYFLSHNERVASLKIFLPDSEYDIYYKNISRTSEYLQNLGKHVSVIWLGPFTEARVNIRDIRGFYSSPFKMNEKALSVYADLDQKLKIYSSGEKHRYQYISLVDMLAISSDFLLTDDCLTYRDGDHFSSCGEEIVGELIKAKLLVLISN